MFRPEKKPNRMDDQNCRKKQPELVRESLLQATRDLTIENGWGNFSLDTIAKKAGVSKGGLMHHFPNKQVLLDALGDQMMAFLDNHIREAMEQDPDPEGRFIRAYLSISLLPEDAPQKKLMIAACLTGPHDERTHQRWHDWIESKMTNSRRYVRDMIVKYAADGLWFDAMHCVKLPANMRSAIIQRLIEITRRKEDPIDEMQP